MPQHSRRPPSPPAPEFYIADPQPPEAPEPETAPGGGQAALGLRPPALANDAAPRKSAAPGTRREPAAENREPTARGWHRSEPWAVVMLASLAIMLAAVYVPHSAKRGLIALAGVVGLVGIVMLARKGLFDEPSPHDE